MNVQKKIKYFIDKKDLHELHSFLEFNGININDILKENFDPLTYAIENGSSNKIIQFLIEKYYNLNYETVTGKIPIFCAIETQNFKISDYMIKKKNGADINYINKNNENILLYLLNRNALTKKALKYSLKKGVNINIQWDKKNSMLIQIIKSHKDGIEDIIKNLFHSTIFTNEFIIRLLTISKAKTQFSLQQFKKLLDDEKAKINITKSTYKCVIDNGLINLLNLLFIHDIHFDLKTKSFDELNGYGLMLRALLYNQFDIVNYLIQFGINKNKIYKNIFTPLTYATYTHIDQVKFLVERGADINVIDGYGHTPLMIASGHGRIKTVQYLVNNGADIHKKNAKGYNALLLSSKYGHFLVLKYLVEKGAHLNEKNNKGDNVLHLSVRHGNLSIIKYLIKSGVSVEEKDCRGYNILMLAAFFGNIEIVQYLIEIGMSIDETDNEGLNILDFAKKGENSDMIEYLIDYIDNKKKI
eukprot:jgi/Orpsp1_1/1175762/evm.model.c7180000055119.2